MASADSDIIVKFDGVQKSYDGETLVYNFAATGIGKLLGDRLEQRAASIDLVWTATP